MNRCAVATASKVHMTATIPCLSYCHNTSKKTCKISTYVSASAKHVHNAGSITRGLCTLPGVRRSSQHPSFSHAHMAHDPQLLVAVDADVFSAWDS